MSVEVLVLNTAAVDFRGAEYGFADKLAGPGGLAKCRTADMPRYSQEQYRRWIGGGQTTTGGPGNSAPLMARANVKVGVGVSLGAGDFDGLDAQGRFFYDVMVANGIDMSATVVHPDLPTGTTFIHERTHDERGGIAYFPNANNDFDFARFRPAVERLRPKIVYYMYSGLSDRGDANGGRDLAAFIRWCRRMGAAAIADCHTLTGDPEGLISRGEAVEAYHLLEPLLGELDMFFTSSDEAKMIYNTLEGGRRWGDFDERENCAHFLDFLMERYPGAGGRTRVYGITVSDGAYFKSASPRGGVSEVVKTESRFMAGEVIDLVGAGDSFRAGFLTYVARNLDAFAAGTIDFREAVGMGNLFAAMFIKAPLQDRYSNIRDYEKMLRAVASGKSYHTLDELTAEIG